MSDLNHSHKSGAPPEGFKSSLLKMPIMCHELDHTGSVVEVSDEWLLTLGYERCDVIGKEFTSFLSENSLQQNREIILPELLNNGRCKGVPLEIVQADGQLLDVLFSAIIESAQGGEVARAFGVLSDNTQQKQAAMELQVFHDELEERVQNRTAALDKAYEHLTLEMKERKRAEVVLRTIAEGVSGTTGVAFFTSLVQFLTKALNVSFAAINVYDEVDDRMVRTVAICMDGEIKENFSYDLTNTPCAKAIDRGICIYPQRVKDFFPEDELLASMDVESYIGVRLRDSAGIPLGLLVVMDSSPLEASGTIMSMLQIYASRVAAELERNKQEDELVRVRNLESLGRMAAGIAHEVNNPLTNASINIQMLRKKLSSLVAETPILKRVDAVERNIERASNIAKELLLFSRQKDLELLPVDINSIIDKSLAQITCDLERVKIEKSLLSSAEILGDSVKLEGLFINLFNNAFDAMPDEGTLSISSFEESGRILVKIHDTGPGILSEDLPKIFEPFFTTKEVGKGTGLGLSIAYGIVRQHHGSIEAVDTKGNGATFLIKIPTCIKGAV